MKKRILIFLAVAACLIAVRAGTPTFFGLNQAAAAPSAAYYYTVSNTTTSPSYNESMGYAGGSYCSYTQITVPVTGTITKIEIEVNTFNVAKHFRYGIFSNSTSAPALLLDAGNLSVTAPTYGWWGPSGLSYSITAGTTIMIGIAPEDASESMVDSTTQTLYVSSTDGYTNGFPKNPGNVTSTDSRALAIRVWVTVP